MQIKRFEAGDMQEALRQVKEAMGSDAIILSTKTVKNPSPRSGYGKRKGVEVVAAIDRHHEPSSARGSFLPTRPLPRSSDIVKGKPLSSSV
jgi:flagellar biosynthesis protein FlhF